MRTRYSARCLRSGNWWAIEVPDVRDGDRARTIHTQARRLDQVDRAARDALSIVLETSPDSFDIEVIPVIDEELAAEVAQARTLRQDAEDAHQQAMEAVRTAARDLDAVYHLPLRDVGYLLDLSFQRVSQLLSSAS